MIPLRMCMVCRERQEKEKLLRIAKTPDGKILLDPEGKLPGRGAYLCRKKECLSKAEKRRALERAFSCKVEENVYKALSDMAGVNEDAV